MSKDCHSNKAQWKFLALKHQHSPVTNWIQKKSLKKRKKERNYQTEENHFYGKDTIEKFVQKKIYQKCGCGKSGKENGKDCCTNLKCSCVKDGKKCGNKCFCKNKCKNR